MPPRSERPQTPASVHSWWSDSNPMLRGPTINLHTATKPLMRLMYHRQALSFIAKDGSGPLSRPLLEIYSSYLLCKYVSLGTQRLVLDHLAERAESVEDARTIFHSTVLDQIFQLLESPHALIRTSTSRLTQNLLRRGLLSTFGSNDDMAEGTTVLMEKLTNLLRVPDQAVAEQTAELLVQFVQSDKSKLPDNGGTRSWASWVSEPVAASVILVEKLAGLLRDQNGNVELVYRGAQTLARVAAHPEGADAIFAANVLPDIRQTLYAPEPDIRSCIHLLAENLTKYEPSAWEILTMGISVERLCSLLQQDKYSPAPVQTAAIRALTKRFVHHSVSRNAAALASAMVLPIVPELLNSRYADVQYETCRLVATVAMYEPSGIQVERLFELMHHIDQRVVSEATHALASLANFDPDPEAAAVVVGANVLSKALDLLDSVDVQVRSQVCTLIRNLANHQAFVYALLALNAIQKLSSLLLSEADDDILATAINALVRLAAFPSGRAAFPSNIQNLLESKNERVFLQACILVGDLAVYRTSVAAILRAVPISRFLFLFRQNDQELVEEAVYALSRLARSSEGASVLAADCAWNTYIPELLGSSAAPVRRASCSLLETLASRESTVHLALEFCTQLVLILHEPDETTRAHAIVALAQISTWPDGVLALGPTDVIAVLQKVEQPAGELEEQISIIRKNVAGTEEFGIYFAL
ncbi:armadillo-type protein [Roridomyces roridus]|uniref:Vacuolar protein 8 n=1 Tax=Roridomyces roridus TaxID=1738132 RepID=A0AAD7BJB6_9AGAR|nr:armadillo-type protein [Roridomyces roridus]